MPDTTGPFGGVLPLPESDTIRDRPAPSALAPSALAPSLRASERTRAGAVAQSWGPGAASAAASAAPSTSASSSASTAGPRLIGGGDLELLGELARGGMGAVYRALDRRLGREVAVKVVLGGGADPEERERFAVEARASARLKHPNIVGIHRVGEERGVPYLVMDLVPGESLQRRIARDGPLPPRDAARVAAKLARALAFAHARGVLHRDLKPHNVLVAQDGEPVLTDFGLAKEVEQSRELTVTGQVLGTPAYMAPEQARGDNERVDRRADVYGLGATLYAALVGHPPFQASGAIALLAKVVEDPVEPPRRARPEVDRDLETIVLKCLEKEPAARYDTAQDLADDLERFLGGEPIRARRLGGLEQVLRWVRRHRLASAGVVGALLLAGGVGVATRVVARDQQLAQARAAVDEARQRAAALSEAQLGPSLRWLQTAQRWRDLAGTQEAREELVAAAFGLAEVAMQDAQWQLAAEALQLSGLAPGDDRLEAALRGVEERRLQVVRDTFRGAMDALERRDVSDPREAAFLLVRHPEPEMVRLLAGRVDEAVEVLRRVRRDLLMGVARPTALEAGAGWRSLEEELRRALDLLDRAEPPPDDPATAEASKVVTIAAARVAARRVRTAMAEVDRPRLGWLEVARAQSRELGDVAEGQVQACLEALGRIAAAERPTAEAAVRAFLRAAVGESSTITASRVLDQLGESIDRLQQLIVTRAGPADLPDGLMATSSRARAPDAEAASSPLDATVVAMRAFNHGDVARARELLRDALERWPDDPGLLRSQALLLQTLGSWDEALAVLERVMAQEPSPLALAWRGRVLAALGQPERGRRDLEEAERLARASGAGAEDWHAIGQTHHALGDATRAEAALLRALEGDPESVSAGLALVQVYFRQGRHEEAAPVLERALRADPQHVVLLLARAELLLNRGDVAAAIDQIERVRAQAPRLPVATELRAQLLLSAERRPEAASAARELLELDPEHPVGRWVLAQVAIAERQPSEADDHCRRGLRRAMAATERVPLLTAHANALLLLGRADEALAAAEEGLALLPQDADALTMRSAARMLLGEPALALADLDQAVASKPTDAELRFARGGLHQRLGDAEAARRDYEAVLELDPRSARARVQLAYVAIGRGELDVAQVELTRAIEAAPDDGEVFLLRAEVRMKARDLDGALADLDGALEKTPTLARAWARRASLRLALGRLDAAAADAARAVELRPSDVPSLQALVPTLVRLGRVDDALSLVESGVPRAVDERDWLQRARADLRARR